MSSTLAEFPNRHTTSGRNPQSRSYQVDELNAAPSRTQNRRYILRTFVLAPVLVCLAIYGIIEAPEIVSQTATLFGSTPSTSQSSSDSLLANTSQWLPILLVLLSAAVLVCMGFFALRDRGKQRRVKGPALVPSPAQTIVTATPGLADAAAAMATASGKPFLIARNERRHAAQEEIRLSRDARISAEVRAVEASRLRIRAAAPTFQPLEAQEPIVRFRTPARRREPVRDMRQAALAAKTRNPQSSDVEPDGPPTAVA